MRSFFFLPTFHQMALPIGITLFTLHRYELGQNPADFDRRTVVNELRGCLTSAGISGGSPGHSFR